MKFSPIPPVRPACPFRQFFLSIGSGLLLLLLLVFPAGAQITPTIVSFTNAYPITILDGNSYSFPSPSTIQVPPLPAGELQSVTVTLYGLSDPSTASILMELAGPTNSGQVVELMWLSGNGPATNATITIADSAAPFPGDASLTTGSYQPSMNASFPPDPTGADFPFVTTNQLAGFIGTTLEGTWSLYEYYEDFNTNGAISGGWSLTFALLVPPAVTTLAASDVSFTNATLNATVNPNGNATMVYFEYGLTTNYGSFSATNTLTSNLENAQAVALAITGLLPGTTNHFQAVAQNSLGTNYGGDLTFVTPPAAPALQVTFTNGSRLVLTVSGSPGSKYIILLTTNLSPPITWTVLTNLTLTSAVQSIVLAPTGQEEFFALATNAPAVTTQPASAVTSASATLNANVNPNGGPVSVYFEYGPTTNYGSFSAINTLASDLEDAQAVALAITGLLPGTTNHFQAVVQNSLGTNYGGDLTFVTPPAAPALQVTFTNGSRLVLTVSGSPGSKYIILLTTNLSPPITWTVLTNLTLTSAVQNIVLGLTGQEEFFALATIAPAATTLAASAVTSAGATLNANVNPNGGPVSVYFEYGTTTAYGNFSATNTLASDLEDAQAVALAITGLTPGTTNHFQAVVQNSLGTNYGGDLTFVTPAPPTPVLGVSFASGSNPVLTLSGSPGNSYSVQFTTNLSPPVSWTPFTNLVLSNSVQSINPGPPTNRMEFFRAVQP